MAVLCRPTLNYSGTGRAVGPAPTVVEILDGRAADLPGWEECGFELLAHTSAVQDWDDDGEVAAVHHPEMEALAARPHRLRSRRRVGPHQAGPRPGGAPRGPRTDPLRPLRLRRRLRHPDPPLDPRGTPRHGHRGPRPQRPDRGDVRRRPRASWCSSSGATSGRRGWICRSPSAMPGRCAPATPDRSPCTTTRVPVVPPSKRCAIVAPDEPDRHRWYAFPELHRRRDRRLPDVRHRARRVRRHLLHAALRVPRSHGGARQARPFQHRAARRLPVRVRRRGPASPVSR